MLNFAYDGSLNGDWIAHYAVRFAPVSAERRLRLLHVRDPAVAAELDGRLARIAAQCQELGVELDTVMEPAGGETVARRLLARALMSPDTLLLAGIRARPRDLGYLAGSVTAALLSEARCPVVALHVVHPAMLGQPDRLLLPVRRRAALSPLLVPLLRLLAPALRELQVLVVDEVSPLHFRLLGARAARRRIDLAHSRAMALETELQTGLGPTPLHWDVGATLSDDLAKETLAWSARQRARLIALDATGLPARPRFAHPHEQVLRDATCDVALYRAARP